MCPGAPMKNECPENVKIVQKMYRNMKEHNVQIPEFVSKHEILDKFRTNSKIPFFHRVYSTSRTDDF